MKKKKKYRSRLPFTKYGPPDATLPDVDVDGQRSSHALRFLSFIYVDFILFWFFFFFVLRRPEDAVNGTPPKAIPIRTPTSTYEISRACRSSLATSEASAYPSQSGCLSRIRLPFMPNVCVDTYVPLSQRVPAPVSNCRRPCSTRWLSKTTHSPARILYWYRFSGARMACQKLRAASCHAVDGLPSCSTSWKGGDHQTERTARASSLCFCAALLLYLLLLLLWSLLLLPWPWCSSMVGRRYWKSWPFLS
ncbi:hypothetical protein VTK73DRAFT_6013 [Phialemonium thermophilum]|uniref:Uncharacterized protein n=1 Tax=Phialemonium thermophilum TaxID=223376 RepID=A0ABR3V099_9PEZI